MYNIKILENAYTAVIELANSCTAKKLSTCRDVYHILKFVRASARDFPEQSDTLGEMSDTLNAHAARLKKMAGGKITEHLIVGENGEIFPLPLSNPCGSLAHLIRRKLNENDVGNFLNIYKISDLYMHRYFEYAYIAANTLDADTWYLYKALVDVLFSKIRKYVGYLEYTMDREGIAFREITM